MKTEMALNEVQFSVWAVLKGKDKLASEEHS